MLTPVQILRWMEWHFVMNIVKWCKGMHSIPIKLQQYADYKKEFKVDTTSRIKIFIANCQATKR